MKTLKKDEMLKKDQVCISHSEIRAFAHASEFSLRMSARNVMFWLNRTHHGSSNSTTLSKILLISI
jgi:hypothetical protein